MIVGPDQKDDRSEPVKKATSITSQTSQQEKGAAPLERKRTSRATVLAQVLSEHFKTTSTFQNENELSLTADDVFIVYADFFILHNITYV